MATPTELTEKDIQTDQQTAQSWSMLWDSQVDAHLSSELRVIPFECHATEHLRGQVCLLASAWQSGFYILTQVLYVSNKVDFVCI